MNGNSKQSTPVPPGVAGLIAYFLPVIGGLLFLFLERENKPVRFHAVQSLSLIHI